MVTEDPFGLEAHNRECPEHSGKHGHYCHSWDGLWICEDCGEWEACTCYDPKPTSVPTILRVAADEYVQAWVRHYGLMQKLPLHGVIFLDNLRELVYAGLRMKLDWEQLGREIEKDE